MFRVVALRTIQRRCFIGSLPLQTVSLAHHKLVPYGGGHGTGYGANRSAYGIRYQSKKSKEDQERDIDELSKEEKNIRKLELQEQLRRLEATEDAEEDETVEIDNNQTASTADSSRNVDSLKQKRFDDDTIDLESSGEENEAKKSDSLLENGRNTDPQTDNNTNKLQKTDENNGQNTSEYHESHHKDEDGTTSSKVGSNFHFDNGPLSVHYSNIETVHRHKNSNTTTVEQEITNRIKVDDDADNIDAAMNVLVQSASLAPGKAFPSIDEKINKEIHQEIDNLPSKKEMRKSKWSRKLAQHLESLQETILTATRALNDVTGYSAIEKLKKSIDKLEDELRESKANVKKAKKAYGEAIHLRSKSQREVNELLTRKSNWNSQDLERFTELYRNDHTNELRENETQKLLNEAELHVDGIQLKLTQLILTRYHEEQIWSDKIRQASTWGTWVIMGANLLLFIIATFFVEPWKRRRLVDAFEKQVKQTLVGISQDDKNVIEPVMDQIRYENSKDYDPALEEVKDFVGNFTFSDETPPTEFAESKPEDVNSDQSKDTTYFVSFRPDNGWKGLQNSIRANFNALVSSNISRLQFEKLDLAFITAFFTLLGGGIGSLVTLYFRHK